MSFTVRWYVCVLFAEKNRLKQKLEETEAAADEQTPPTASKVTNTDAAETGHEQIETSETSEV